ncbi:SMU1112c/YaeR family gloxylase I-like metalloprotein [Lacipirellula sp.]|uniref:SMU1112c/YaeR family gloxylase I-like metalloprotein n=1 Tax=Lacipirellula sp. TaxID=2691419 RepID=UPI003D09E8C3
MNELLGMHHVALICSNYEASKKFYTSVLGLKVLSEIYRADRQSYKLDLELPGGVQIELFSFPESPKRLSYPEACGLRHLALKVSDIERVINRLEQQGIEVEPVRTDESTGKKFSFFSDPDGLPIELYEA